MADAKPRPLGTLLLQVIPDPERPGKDAPGKPLPLSLTVIELVLVGTAEVPLVRDRPLDLDLARKAGTSFVLAVPAGRYGAVRLTVRRSGQDTVAGKLAIDLEVATAETATVALAIDAAAARRPDLKDLAAAIRVLPSHADDAVKAAVGSDGTVAFGLAVDVAPGSFAPRRQPAAGDRLPSLRGTAVQNVRLRSPEGTWPAGAEVSLRVPRLPRPADGAPAPGGLPALFRRQRAVGPVVEVVASRPPAGPLQLTLPYDAVAVAAAGADDDDLVVLQLDDARTLYRELRPRQVDREAHTLTIETRTLSSFFPCTAGIAITAPELRRDAAGGATAWSARPEATIAGQIADERASAGIHDAVAEQPLPSARSWQALGWFDFEGVPLQARATFVRVRAEVEGLLAHECEFAIRASPPPKRITDPSRNYGPRLAVGSDDVPLVTAVVGSGRFFGDDLVAPLDGWQRGYTRYGPYVYRPTGDGGDWEWRQLLPELHFEEAAAQLALGMLRAIANIPPAPGAPADRRSLAALAAFVTANAADPRVAPTVTNFLNTAGQAFGLASLSLSPVAPIVALPGGRFAIAFVAATPDGVSAAAASRLQQTLARLHSPLGSPPLVIGQVNAGRLFFVGGSFEDGFQRETVADGVWCATVQLRIDPANGLPVVAAIEPLPDAGDQPQARLVLFRRQPNGAWAREVVSASAPIVDFDFDFAPAPRDPEAGSPVGFVAAVAGRDFDIKTHMRFIGREPAGWLSTPFEYEAPWRPGTILDLGLWPRLSIDEAGNGAIAFASHSLGQVTWLLAAVENSVLRTSVIAGSSHQELTGSPLPPTRAILQVDSPVNASRLSLAHWAPSIARAEPGTLWCAFGNGVLNLARIEIASRQQTIQVVDVDRMTGFYPTVATRRAGAPAIAYKDPWGPGQFGADAHDDLFFFSLEQGNVVPPAELPLAPPHVRDSFSLSELAPYLRLDCGTLAGEDFQAILASIVLHRPFDIVLVPREGDDPLTLTEIARSHPGVAGQLGRLRQRPTVLALTIDNRGRGEDIESVEIASFTDAIGTVPRSEITQLDRGVMTATVLAALMATGTRLSRTPPRVVVRQPGSAWDIVDDEAYPGGGLNPTLPQVYFLRDNGSELEYRLPPAITVVDAAGRIDDDTRRPVPCGLTVEQWDEMAAPLADQLNILEFRIPDIPGRLRRITARGINVSRVAPRDPPPPQQGGVRFTIEVPRFTAITADPDAVAFSTEPSLIQLTYAPFVQNGWIRWWPRESEVQLGHVEVDVAFGFFDWLAVVVSLIPGLGFVFLAVDAVADSWATSDVNEGLRPPNTGNLQNLLGQVIQHITDLRGAAQPRPLEAAFLRAMRFTTWRRARELRTDAPPESILNVIPALIAFGAHVAGAAPVRRNLLITSDGGVPALVEGVRLVGGGEFRIVSPATWPAVLLPGASEIVTLELTPAAPPGFRNDRIEVRYNGGRTAGASVSALVQPPPEPLLRLRPEQVQFGVVSVGGEARREVEIFNDGAAPLDVAALELAAPGLPAGMLALETVAPLSVPAGGSAVATLRLSPPFGGPNGVQATLVIRSNDPVRPRIELPVTGTVASGALLVTPTLLAFPQSPIAANLPQLPPGLPPTIHRGPTRMTTVYNQGAANLTLLGPSLRAVDAAGNASPHFALWLADGSALAVADRILLAGDSLLIVAEFAAAAPGDHQARIEVRGTDPTQVPATATLQGVAV